MYMYITDKSMKKCSGCCDRDGKIASLKERVKQLEARFAQDSSNSSKPPSSDGLKKKPVIPGSQRRPSGKKPGGQPGHKGATLSPISSPDKIVSHAVTRCDCGADMSRIKPDKVETSQVFDLPPTKIEVTEHRFETKTCPCCRKKVTAELPPGLKGAPVEYGPQIKALSIYLMDQHLIPSRRVSEILNELYGVEVSIGSILQWSTETFGGLAGFEQDLTGALIRSDAVNFDETGMRCFGSLHWLHNASTATLTFFGIHTERGATAMDDFGILPNFRGIAIHDHWKPYFTFRDCIHALCNAHILRELTFLDEVLGERWAGRMKRLLLDVHERVKTAKAEGTKKIPRSARKKFLRRYEKILRAGLRFHATHDPVFKRGARGRAKQTKGKNLLDRLRNFQTEVLRFMNDFRAPFTNNQGEQDIRMNKVKQKISGCFRSLDGAKEFCRIRSYLSTMRKQGANLLAAIHAVFLGEPLHLALPP